MKKSTSELSLHSRQYSTPRLTCFGSVSQLTTTGSGTMDEGTSGGNPPMCVSNAAKMFCGIP